MALEQVRAAVVDAGLGVADLGWGEGAPDHRWTVREMSDDAGERVLLLGGTDHGQWRTWREFADTPGGTDDLVKALWDVRRRAEPARLPRTLAETSQAAALGVEMMDRAASWATGSDSDASATELPASEIKVGTPLDHVGDESGHVLHHFGTPWQKRALPDVDHALPATGYLLVHVLPVACRAERVPPAHGQPGGAWRIVLDRPIAAYVDSGALRPFLPRDA